MEQLNRRRLTKRSLLARLHLPRSLESDNLMDEISNDLEEKKKLIQHLLTDTGVHSARGGCKELTS